MDAVSTGLQAISSARTSLRTELGIPFGVMRILAVNIPTRVNIRAHFGVIEATRCSFFRAFFTIAAWAYEDLRVPKTTVQPPALIPQLAH